MTKTEAFFLSLVAVLVCMGSLFGQTPAPTTSDTRKFEGAANRWMLTPIDVATQKDTATSAERAERDLHWDSVVGQPGPLSEEQTSYDMFFDGYPMPNAPEFPTVANGLWVVGKFESCHTFLSASQRSVYTEINVRVQRVLDGGDAYGLREGALIDVGRGGGTVIPPWNKDIPYTYLVRPRRFDSRPGHTYLLLLQYRAQGNYYLQEKRWDLTNGTVQPDEEVEVERAKRGQSEIDGLSVPQMLELLNRKFEAKQE